MSVDVDRIAEVVLYEGYLLYPYRPSSLKNQQRWTFGGVYPRDYSEASGGSDPWMMQTECLVEGDEDIRLEIKVRYLQVVDRQVMERTGSELRPVAELRVGDEVFRSWEEAVEREVVLGPIRLGAPQTLRTEDPSLENRAVGRVREAVPRRLVPADANVAQPTDEGGGPLRSARVRPTGLFNNDASPLLHTGDPLPTGLHAELHVSAGSEDEPLPQSAGLLRRTWQDIEGQIEVTVEQVEREAGTASHTPSLYRVAVRITNTTPGTWTGRGSEERQQVLRHTCVSTHTILRVENGRFISLLEPEEHHAAAAGECVNLHTWPVLVGEPGERHTMLSSPIILYDYPWIAPESHGNFFDTTEIDELLTLSVMTLTDEEKREMRESDPRGREILERTESLTPDQLMQLHGAMRSMRMVREEGP